MLEKQKKLIHVDESDIAFPLKPSVLESLNSYCASEVTTFTDSNTLRLQGSGFAEVHLLRKLMRRKHVPITFSIAEGLIEDFLLNLVRESYQSLVDQGPKTYAKSFKLRRLDGTLEIAVALSHSDVLIRITYKNQRVSGGSQLIERIISTSSLIGTSIPTGAPVTSFFSLKHGVTSSLLWSRVFVDGREPIA